VSEKGNDIDQFDVILRALNIILTASTLVTVLFGLNVQSS